MAPNMSLSHDSSQESGDISAVLEEYVGDKELVILLDYDGTLTPIVAHPDLATIPAETKAVLQRIVRLNNVYTAIISGRQVLNVRQMVDVEGITYCGNHGLDMIDADGTELHHKVAPDILEKVKLMAADLERECGKDGAWVEDKGPLLTFHYRAVPEDKREELVGEARRIIAAAGMVVADAKCALETKPKLDMDKAKASKFFLNSKFGVDWKDRARVIYVGDDVADEEAMKVLKKDVFTVRVAESDDTPTVAHRRLATPTEVLGLLKWVVKFMGASGADRTDSGDRNVGLSGGLVDACGTG